MTGEAARCSDFMLRGLCATKFVTQRPLSLYHDIMLLLSFTVRNHRSLRDEVTIDLMRPALRTLQPKDGDWAAVTYPALGIFGANATGKSAIVDAITYALTAIRSSAGSWQERTGMPRAPFALDAASAESSSMYEFDFVLDGRRHVYGFEVDAEGVKLEWLKDIPRTRWRTLLDRDREREFPKFHPSVRAFEVSDRELALSRALRLKQSLLRDVAEALVGTCDIVLVNDSHREVRLSNIAQSLADQSIALSDLTALLLVADIGIEGVEVEEHELPDDFRKALRAFTQVLRDERESAEETGDQTKARRQPDEEELRKVVRHLVFTHRGAKEGSAPFSVQDESNGTVAWLAVAVPVLEVLRSGGVLVVDELDASLHPHLVELVVGAFSDPEVNTRQAQLIFTSHESYILSPWSEVKLSPEQVWFTDKGRDGVTDLFSLADFPKHRDANVAKRYLLGKYGGTPHLAPNIFAALVTDALEEAS